LRLFSLVVNKEASLSDCGVWVNNVWVWRLFWRRGLLVWEVPLVRQLNEVLLGVSSASESVDRWVWKDNNSEEFSIQFAYGFLIGEAKGGNQQMYESFWKIKVLPSAQITTWRVIENKIATRVNLERHCVAVKSNLCCLCEVLEESTSHLFFGCRVS